MKRRCFRYLPDWLLSSLQHANSTWQTRQSSQRGSRGGWIFRLRSCSKGFESWPGFEFFFTFGNPSPVQTLATIDATAIQQRLLCTEAMTSVNTMQTPATAENKNWLQVILTPGPKQKRRILLESTPEWPLLLSIILHKQSAAQN